MDCVTRMRALTGGALCLCASVLVPVDSRTAEAQQVFESYQLNLAKIEFNYQPGGEASPFGLDLTLTREGPLVGQLFRLHKSTNVTLKRGVMHEVGPEVQTVLTGPVVDAAAGAASPLGTLETTLVGALSGTTTSATEAATVAFSGGVYVAAGDTNDLGALVTFEIADGAAALAQFSMRFNPAPGVQLVCRPAALCNQPGPGEPLIVRLPRLAPGEALDIVLEVTPARGSGHILIPIKVKHNI